MSRPPGGRARRGAERSLPCGRWILVVACAWATTVTPFATPCRAQSMDGGGTPISDAGPVVASGPDDAQRWWGAAGAVLCATEVRLMRVVPAIGFNPYVIAAGLGGCILAAMDVMTTE